MQVQSNQQADTRLVQENDALGKQVRILQATEEALTLKIEIEAEEKLIQTSAIEDLTQQVEEKNHALAERDTKEM